MTTFEFYKEESLRMTDQKVFETTCEKAKTAKQRLNKVHDGSFPVVMVEKMNGITIGKETIYFQNFIK